MIGYDKGAYSATFMRVSKHRMNLPGTGQGRERLMFNRVALVLL